MLLKGVLCSRRCFSFPDGCFSFPVELGRPRVLHLGGRRCASPPTPSRLFFFFGCLLLQQHSFQPTTTRRRQGLVWAASSAAKATGTWTTPTTRAAATTTTRAPSHPTATQPHDQHPARMPAGRLGCLVLLLLLSLMLPLWPSLRRCMLLWLRRRQRGKHDAQLGCKNNQRKRPPTPPLTT